MSLLHQIQFDPSNMSAFGTLETNELTPILQGDFVYGLNRQIWQYNYYFTVTAPAVAPAAGDIYTNNNNFYSIIYQSGTLLIAQGTGDPTATGTLVRSNGSGSTPITYSAYTFTGCVMVGTNAMVSTANGLQTITTGATTSGNMAHVMTRKIIRYRAGQGNVIRMTPVFANAATNCLQLYGVGTIVNNAPYDGYYFGYESAASNPRFGIHHYKAGSVVSFTPQASWLSQTDYNPARGYPLMIKYPYLGYGDIEFFVESPSAGRFELVHLIQYAGSSAAVQLANPSMQLVGYAKNTGTAGAIATITCGSYAALLSGVRSFSPSPKWAVDQVSGSITSTESNIITIRNCTKYNGVDNRGMIRLNQISLGLKEATVVTIRFRINATLGGTPSWTAVAGSIADGGATLTNAQSIASYDVAGTTVTQGNGTYRFNMTIGASGTVVMDLTPYEIYIAPGEQLVISGVATGNSTVGTSINWSEDI